MLIKQNYGLFPLALGFLHCNFCCNSDITQKVSHTPWAQYWAKEAPSFNKAQEYHEVISCYIVLHPFNFFSMSMYWFEINILIGFFLGFFWPMIYNNYHPFKVYTFVTNIFSIDIMMSSSFTLFGPIEHFCFIKPIRFWLNNWN